MCAEREREREERHTLSRGRTLARRRGKERGKRLKGGDGKAEGPIAAREEEAITAVERPALQNRETVVLPSELLDPTPLLLGSRTGTN